MGHSSVKLTVGVCVKNSEAIIKKAVNSILAQSFPVNSMELIVVDGQSKDKTLEVIKNTLKDTGLKFRIFSENTGLGFARQMVVENADGEYIVWVDADMILPKSYFPNLVNIMEEDKSVGIAAGKYAVYMGQGVAADLENVVYAVDSVFGEASFSKYGYLPGTEGSIFRTIAIRKIGGFDVRMDGAAEDTEVAYRMSQSGWKIIKTREQFAESTRQSWSSLWNQYVWYGRGGHFIFHKNTGSLSILKMTPIAGFLAGLIRLPKAYLLVKKNVVLLLPVHYTFKRIAWFFGFVSAHRDGYGHFD